ncbi:SprB repeat-containing protein [Carboxylicivirga sp. M1479]|uniref:SprB repeat-containing protein n=1 Tax=Carboxylicivirga sp. M1479 TaxID=2594476 RepID=UPI001177ACE0|nr:SprB repeat-containing protein [Carboxylicivirga sp. M1479]TRX62817.1 hypothetical protein FNN09_19480 [Carboxylicivirga sp. M1479]
MKSRLQKRLGRLHVGILVAILPFGSFNSTLAQKCNDCFKTELISIYEEDACLHVELQINANECGQALSHFTIEVACGDITDASNSGNWPMEINNTDPTTNIHGLKVDDIKNFGEDGQNNSFTLKYTVCTDNEECKKQLMHQSFVVAYKAGTCVFTDSITLVENRLDAEVTPKHISCHGDNSGAIDISISNGTPPYAFEWSNGATTKDIDNLTAGTYSLIITDAKGETLTLETIITQATELNVIADITHANCGSSDGAIELNVSGANAPYEYTWNTDATSASINNISGGNYSVTITDYAGCVNSYSYNIIDQTDLRAMVSTSVIECYEEGTGSLTVTPDRGTEPYTYLWGNGSTDATAANLSSGSHRVTVTDANGCSIIKTGYVIIKQLNIQHSLVEPKCFGDNTGSITLDISNGTEPYDIAWNTGDTTATINNLNGAWYWADIIDAKGCTGKEYVKVSEPNKISLNTTVTRLNCDAADSTIVVTINGAGGTPPYEIYYNDAIIDEEIHVDKEGYYEFTAVDANGCSITQSVYIHRPDAGLDIALNIQQPSCDQINGTAELIFENGAAPYVIMWSDGNTNAIRNDLQAGNYQVTVEDTNGCTASKEVNINLLTIPSVAIIAPIVSPICNTSDNVLNAVVENAESFTWSMQANESSWHIQSQEINQILYSSGDGTTVVNIEVSSKDGCTVVDTIELACNNDSSNENGGGDDNENDDNTPIGNCENTCFDIVPVEWQQTNPGCYTYHAKVITDGTCRYELSHLTLQIDNGTVELVENSRNWKSELNNTDPTTGLHGFKIDDISNFGKTNDSFDLRFNICFDAINPQTEFTIAYKAAQCVILDTLVFETTHKELSALSYPNPFINQTNIEFTPDENAYAIVNIYGVNGELIECLYQGNVEKGINYIFNFKAQNSASNIYFYRIICGNQSCQGKLIQTKN